MIEHIINLLAPHRCISCAQEGSLLCYECGQGLASAPSRCLVCVENCSCSLAKGEIFCATLYSAEAKEIVRKLKFERARAAADDMARIIAERLPEIDTQTVVVHVPTAPKRVRQRGYDQAKVLARCLARHIGKPSASLLYRDTNSRQVGKGRSARQQQADHLFAANATAPPEHILLIDDVLTTGSTLRAAARVLYDAGAQHIDAAVFVSA